MKEEFHKNFSFTMKPLLVKGGQKDWNAKNVFSLDYFRSIYPKKSQVRKYIKFCKLNLKRILIKNVFCL